MFSITIMTAYEQGLAIEDKYYGDTENPYIYNDIIGHQIALLACMFKLTEDEMETLKRLNNEMSDTDWMQWSTGYHETNQDKPAQPFF